jgi:cytoskeletal protein CcmA (bactofilin family)
MLFHVVIYVCKKKTKIKHHTKPRREFQTFRLLPNHILLSENFKFLFPVHFSIDMSLAQTGTSGKGDVLFSLPESLNHISLFDNISTSIGNGALDANLLGILNTVVGYRAVGSPTSISGDGISAFGTETLYLNRGSYNSAFGTRAGYSNTTGTNNSYYGYSAGYNNVSGRNQTSIGFQAGFNVTGDNNVYVGSLAGSKATSTSSNIGIGYNANASAGGSVGLGAGTDIRGLNSIGIGTGVSSFGSNSLIMGSGVTSTGSKSLILLPRQDGLPYTSSEAETLNIYGRILGEREITGNYKVSLTGDRILINNAYNRINLDPAGMSFYSDSNIAYLSPTIYTSGLKVVSGKASFDVPTTFDGHVDFRSSVSLGNVSSISITDAQIENLTVNGRLNVNEPRFESLEVYGPTTLYGSTRLVDVTTATMSNAIIADLRVERSATLCNSSFDGESTFRGLVRFKSGIHVCCGPLEADEIVVHNLRVDHLAVDGIFSVDEANIGHARISNLESDTISVSNSLNVAGLLTSLSITTESSIITGESGLTVLGPTVLNSVSACNINSLVANINTVNSSNVVSEYVYTSNIGGINASFSNGSFCNVYADNLVLRGDIIGMGIGLHDVSLTGKTTVVGIEVLNDAIIKGDLFVGGKLKADRFEITGGFDINTGFPFIIEDPLVCNDTLTVLGESEFKDIVFDDCVAGSIVVDRISVDGESEFKGCVHWVNPLDPSGESGWHACLVNKTSQSADLEFKSGNGTLFSMVDVFETGVLNFTGKHRCNLKRSKRDCPSIQPGMIVSCIGTVCNLDGSRDASIDDAIPEVDISTLRCDSNAFGVFVDFEPIGKAIFKLANFVFNRSVVHNRSLAIVNSVGEGGMWVCDSSGVIKLGDLLTTSDVIGHAEKQADDIIRSYTIAKVTSNPKKWTIVPKEYMCTDKLKSKLQSVKRAFVGVIYKF